MKPRLRFSWTALVITLTICATQIAANSETAGSWPQFRGHLRDGISSETGLLDSWPKNGPREIWRRPIGIGYSGIVIADGRFYTLFMESTGEEERQYAAAYDTATGQEIWRTDIGGEFANEYGGGPRSTPTLDGETVYVLSANGDLAALATTDGGKRWAVNLLEKFGGEVPYWGFSTSTMVAGDLLIVEGGGTEGNSYAGLDKKTGEVRWTAGDRVFNFGYASAVPLTLAGEQQVVYVTGNELVGVTADGHPRWSHPWKPAKALATPLFIAPDGIFVSDGLAGSMMVRISRDGEAFKVEEVWASRSMKNHFSTSVLYDGYIYGFDNATLKCIAAAEGVEAWARRGFGKGSLIVADGHLYILSDRGELVLAEATPTGWVEKGRVQALQGKSWTLLSLAGGRLYLRNNTEMVSYDIKKDRR